MNKPPNITAAKLSAVLVELADYQPSIQFEGPTANYSFGRGEAKVMLAIRSVPEGSERLTRAVLVLGTGDQSAKIAALLGLACPRERSNFEFCDHEGERLDVYAPRLVALEDSATIFNFIKLPAAA